MTARGAADFLTRSTAMLGALFIMLSILLAAYAGATAKPVTVDTSLVNQASPVVPATNPAPMPGVPAKQPPAPVTRQPAPAVPLAQ